MSLLNTTIPLELQLFSFDFTFLTLHLLLFLFVCYILRYYIDYRQWVQRSHNGSALSPDGSDQQANMDKGLAVPPTPLSERMRKRRGKTSLIDELFT